MISFLGCGCGDAGIPVQILIRGKYCSFSALKSVFKKRLLNDLS
jgi:hypothetical protein